MKKTSIRFLLLTSLLLLLSSCKDSSVPKSRGYVRIDVPEKPTYVKPQIQMPFSFEMSDLARLYPSKEMGSNSWFNIDYSQWKGRIYLSYFQLNDTSLQPLIEDARRFAYKHTVKASSIEESVFSFEAKNVHGLLYDIGGDAASSVQFFATDSVNNFLLGSLYFNTVPNRDSLNPVINYIRQDILHLIETLEWEK